MTLPWNRSDPAGGSDSLVDRVPLVRRVLAPDAEPVPERSEPTVVAAPGGRGVDVRAAPDGSRSTGRSTDDPDEPGDPGDPGAGASSDPGAGASGDPDDPDSPDEPDLGSGDPTALVEQ